MFLGSNELVELLLDAGSDPNTTADNGQVSLQTKYLRENSSSLFFYLFTFFYYLHN